MRLIRGTASWLAGFNGNEGVDPGAGAGIAARSIRWIRARIFWSSGVESGLAIGLNFSAAASNIEVNKFDAQLLAGGPIAVKFSVYRGRNWVGKACLKKVVFRCFLSTQILARLVVKSA